MGDLQLTQHVHDQDAEFLPGHIIAAHAQCRVDMGTGLHGLIVEAIDSAGAALENILGLISGKSRLDFIGNGRETSWPLGLSNGT
jgi:hypothetical protein